MYKMESYCLNHIVSSTSNGRAMVLSKCAICGSKKSGFITNQETKEAN